MYVYYFIFRRPKIIKKIECILYVYITVHIIAVFWIVKCNRRHISLRKNSCNKIGNRLPKDFGDYQVELYVQNTKISCMGMIDTGNQLYEPISKKPVCIISKALIYRYMMDVDLNTLRIIPAITVRGRSLMYAFRIDKLIIKKNHRYMLLKGVYVAVSSYTFRKYQVLLHPDLW